MSSAILIDLLGSKNKYSGLAKAIREYQPDIFEVLPSVSTLDDGKL
jgi:hypothetical protein